VFEKENRKPAKKPVLVFYTGTGFFYFFGKKNR